MQGMTYSRKFIVFMGLEKGWLGWLALFLLASALIVSLWSGLRRPAASRNLPMLLLRSVGLLILAIFVLQPAVRLQKVIRKRAHLVFLMDCSRSMSVKDDPGGLTRAKKIGAFFKDNKDAMDKLASKFIMDFYCFGGRVRPMSRTRAMKGPDPVEPKTDINGALTEILSAVPAGDLSGIILISDGRDRSAKAGPVDMPVPVYAIAPAASGELADVAVSSVKADDFAFVRTPTKVKTRISITGMDREEIPVTLLKDGSPLVTRLARIGPDKTAVVELPFNPTRVGKAALAVTVPDFPEDTLKDNNRLEFSLEVLRDRIRVLHVAGRPSWDVRFLRELLKRDPSVDLISFFILRTPGDLAVGTNDELSLIRFPVQELFAGALDTFDLVIFQNFTYRGYQMRPYLKNIRNHVVQGGGAFVMIGGEQSFSSGGYDGTYIEDILPVNLTGNYGSDSAMFRPKLTRTGLYHPVSSFAATPAGNKALWSRLPKLPGCNLGLSAKPGAAVLAVHPFIKSPDGSPLPLLSVTEAGKGRTMAIAWDGSWKWRFSGRATDASIRTYRRFFRGAMRWLVRDPSVAPVRFIKGGGRQPAGKPLDLVLKVMRPDYEPASGARVNVRLENGNQNGQVFQAQGTADHDGIVHIKMPAPAKGAYKLVAEAFYKGASLGQVKDITVVGGADPELLDPRINREKLQDLAKASNGSFHVLPFDLSNLDIKDPKPLQVTGQRDHQLWDKWWLAGLGISFLCLEWFLRRRIGLA
ncbi:MAG: hypothetical protein GXP49_06830 [Deltaproteobacteria bacterium]|nr:hypothetical protein [Deltaproteobacteria bacterium]